MEAKLFHEIQGLSRMTVGELREKYAEANGIAIREYGFLGGDV